MKYGEIGILQIGNERYGFRPLDMTREFMSSPILRGELLDMFPASNRKAKAEEYLRGIDLARPQIKNVIFNDPATVVYWDDGTRTVVKCQEGDTYSKETGLALCIVKKYFGNKGNFNGVFKKWIPEETEAVEKTETVEEISVEKMRVELEEFCDVRSNCRFCPLKDPCRCGRGAFFTTKSRGEYDMSDDEIRDAYRIALLKK